MQTVVSVSSRRIVTFLGAITLGFATANLVRIGLQHGFQHSSFFGLVVFDLGMERSIPTWFASAQLLLCAILLALIAQIKQVMQGSYRLHWILLSAVFVVLSIDEAVAFHERSIKPLRSALNTSGFLHFAWVIPAAFFVLAMLLLYRKFLLHLPAETRFLILMAGSTYIMGAMGMEMLGAPFWKAASRNDLVKDLFIVAEETLELVGIEIFIYALLRYLSESCQGMRLVVDAGRLASCSRPSLRS